MTKKHRYVADGHVAADVGEGTFVEVMCQDVRNKRQNTNATSEYAAHFQAQIVQGVDKTEVWKKHVRPLDQNRVEI